MDKSPHSPLTPAHVKLIRFLATTSAQAWMAETEKSTKVKSHASSNIRQIQHRQASRNLT